MTSLLLALLAVGGVTGDSLWQLSRQLFGDDKGIELNLPPRSGDRPAPDFGE